jgi:hypothetical protein
MSGESRGYTQTREELVTHLHDQIGHLRRSAAAFDGGAEGEAARLALSIRVLLHDTKKSKSLLGQLGVKERLRFLESSLGVTRLQDNHPGRDCGLLSIELDPQNGAGRYFAPLEKLPPERLRQRAKFSAWWSMKVFEGKVSLSRKDLVLAFADTDGGAHVDARLMDEYANLTRRNAPGWALSDSDGTHPLKGAGHASVRQMAYELSSTLDDQLSASGELVEPASPGRNDPCGCGSGKKFKHCCGR